MLLLSSMENQLAECNQEGSSFPEDGHQAILKSEQNVKDKQKADEH